ncbi:MAG: tetratricopeptide repeat protein [Alphaproteobacteria bacterium]|nr:tetratricopeptide repeat protein [Alphaproteobacteria bacterium]
MRLILGLLLLASGCEAPRFERFSDALSDYEQARAALDGGRAAEAVQALERATRSDPASPELWLWLGAARAEAGDADGAVVAATEALARRPGWAEALYNRACWRLAGASEADARQLSGADLQAALATGVIDPLTAATDPDLQALRDDPATAALVPVAALPAGIEVRDATVFLGSEWTVTLWANHRAADPLEVRLDGTPPQHLQPLRVVEEWSEAGPLRRTELRFAFQATGAEETTIGPWTLSASGLRATLEPVPLRLLAPEGHTAPPRPLPEGAFTAPSVRFAEVPEPGAVRQGATVLVRAAPGDAVVMDGATEMVRHEVREAGIVRWVGFSATLPPDTAVRIRRAGATLWEGTP